MLFVAWGPFKNLDLDHCSAGRRNPKICLFFLFLQVSFLLVMAFAGPELNFLSIGRFPLYYKLNSIVTTKNIDLGKYLIINCFKISKVKLNDEFNESQKKNIQTKEIRQANPPATSQTFRTSHMLRLEVQMRQCAYVNMNFIWKIVFFFQKSQYLVQRSNQ